MAKLLTHHDRFHGHAILGSLALIHFFYRFVCLFFFGGETFRADLPSAIGLGIHVCLHATSFQFHLPRERIWSMPMIWREFRVHNAIFALRNLLAAALGCFATTWWLDSPRSPTSIAAKGALVFATMYAADVTTARLGSKEKRTTNAMPYPACVTPEVERTIKRFYAKAQFAATSLAMYGTPVLAFGSVLAIEGASLLMTLVRKGIVSATFYHVVYSLTLFIMFPAMMVTLHLGDERMMMGTFRCFLICAVATTLRVGREVKPWGKYWAWGVGIPCGLLAAEVIPRFMSPVLMCWLGAAWSMADTLQEFRLACRTKEKKGEEDARSTAAGSGDSGAADTGDETSNKEEEPAPGQEKKSD